MKKQKTPEEITDLARACMDYEPEHLVVLFDDIHGWPTFEINPFLVKNVSWTEEDGEVVDITLHFKTSKDFPKI